MTTFREVLLKWTMPNGLVTNSVINWYEGMPVETMRSTIAGALGHLSPYLTPDTLWEIPLGGKLINDATGQQIGGWTASLARTGGGSGGSQPLPDAAMGLVRYRTDQIINGRYVNGRTYIPGLSTGAADGGNVSTGCLAALQSFGDALVGSNKLYVYSRPKGAGAGTILASTRAEAWNEFAILRRRRNR